MPINLAKLQKETAVVTVSYRDDTAKVTYRVNAITPLFQRSLAGLNNHESLVQMVKVAVVDWDVVECEGGPKIQPDSVEVAQLPTEFLDAVSIAILEDMKHGNATDDRRRAAGAA